MAERGLIGDGNVPRVGGIIIHHCPAGSRFCISSEGFRHDTDLRYILTIRV